MDFIERLFGMSPDGGGGATELVILLGVTLLAAVLSTGFRAVRHVCGASAHRTSRARR